MKYVLPIMAGVAMGLFISIVLKSITNKEQASRYFHIRYLVNGKGDSSGHWYHAEISRECKNMGYPNAHEIRTDAMHGKDTAYWQEPLIIEISEFKTKDDYESFYSH